MISKRRLIYSGIVLTIVIIIGISINKIFDNNKKKEVFRDYPEIEESGVLNIVTNYNPVNYYVSGDSLAGFTYDILQVLAAKTTIRLNIELENDLEKCINGLENGKYDIIAQNIPVNMSLKDKIVFTEPLIQNKLVLVQRSSNQENKLIRNHLELAGKTIYIPRYSPTILRLQNLSDEIGDTIFVKEDSLYDIPQLIMKVASGEIDLTISDIETAENLKKLFPEIDIETDIGFTHFEAWALRRNSPILLEYLNSKIKEIRTSREYALIYNKYYQ